MLVSLTQIFECLHLHHSERGLDPELWEAFDQRLRDVFATPGAQHWWTLRRHWHTLRFQRHVDRAIAQSHESAGRYVAIYGKDFSTVPESASAAAAAEEPPPIRAAS